MGKDRQVVFDFGESLERLNKTLEGIAPAVEVGINDAIRGVAEAAYASIVAKAQSQLQSTRQDYLSGLRFENLDDNSYMISLEGEWANKLEEGFGAYDLRTVLLKSTKTVEVGSRSGQPWVQTGKKGQKYAHVPFEHQPFAKAGRAGDMAEAVQSLTGINVKGNLQALTKVFRDMDGKPLEGRVAVAHLGSVKDPRLENLTKYQSVVTDKNGKQRVQSTYLTYRTISELGKPWIHPGYDGVQAFQDAEREIQAQIDKIINTML